MSQCECRAKKPCPSHQNVFEILDSAGYDPYFCKKCDTWKMAEAFAFRNRKLGTRRPECKICMQKYQEPRRKGYKLKQKYGISYETWKNMLVKQDERCGICNRKTELSVDHCHATGKIRDLLCGSCNRALGLLQDSPDVAQRAVDYLIRWKADTEISPLGGDHGR